MRTPTSEGRRSNKRNGAPDRPLFVVALAVLLVLYGAVTLVTYARIARIHHTPIVGDLQQQQQQGRPQVVSKHKEGMGTVETLQELLQTQGSSAAIQRLQETFPLHTSAQDSEEIMHPGYASLEPAKQAQWPPTLPKHMTVPRFFDDAFGFVYNSTSIREYLGNGQLMTPTQASHVGSTITAADSSQLETIYCSVASYRDYECSATVADIYERAEHPDRIRVAILDQRTAEDPVCGPQNCAQQPNQTLCLYQHLIDRYEMDARFGVGPVFARHLAHRHYRGEYFAMQVDSHVRFVEHWDSNLIDQWKSAKNEMAVLTTYLSDIIGSIDPDTHESTHPGRPIMCQSDYEGNGQYRHLRHGQQPEGQPGIHGQPTLEPFWAAGFSFARGHFVVQVPYDQYLPMVFQGEEISIGLRGFTVGYDYYTPEKSVCFHMYAIKENQAKRKKVPLFWENGKIYGGVGMKAMKRLNSIIGMEQWPENEWIQTDQEKYGLGQVRTTSKFFETFGIHTEKHSVEHHLCRFVGKPMMKEFLPALRPDGMGLDYSKINYKFVDPDKKNEQTNAKREKFRVLQQQK